MLKTRIKERGSAFRNPEPEKKSEYDKASFTFEGFSKDPVEEKKRRNEKI